MNFPSTLQRQVQNKVISDLALPRRGLPPIATSTATTRVTYPSYTSLSEIISTPAFPMIESVETPRTPLRNRLVEKAARAYLLPSDSFDKRNADSSRGKHPLSRFLPSLSAITTALNPVNVFNSACQVLRFYLTGARALHPQIKATVSRAVSRSISMPILRMAHAHDLSILIFNECGVVSCDRGLSRRCGDSNPDDAALEPVAQELMQRVQSWLESTWKK